VGWRRKGASLGGVPGQDERERKMKIQAEGYTGRGIYRPREATVR
jgi:hypothetical protein